MEQNKIQQEINNIVGDNLKALAQLFPSAVKDGMLDVEALKEELGEFEEVDAEKYELTWSGKQNAKKLAQSDVCNRTLKYIEKDSKNPDTTENLYIEGDNLEVLKLLRQNYFGSIKMIYIDPPYNTGNDFVYNDKFSMDKKESDIAEGTSDEDGNPLQKNQQSSNRYHANWLNMMYPRLKLAKDLLTDDGVIFISIDDNEVKSLKQSCDEIFGESNFVSNMIWRSRTSISNDHEVSMNHNHTLIYCKNRNSLKFGGDLIDPNEYINPDNDKRGPWKLVPIDANHIGGDTVYGIINPKTNQEYFPPNGRIWAYNKQTFASLLNDGRIKFGLTDDSSPKRKLYYNERIAKGDKKTPSSIIIDAGTTKDGTKLIMNLFNGGKYFDYPKSLELMKRLCLYGTYSKNGVILDFFSGSATTAHAVMQLNAEDGGNRKFIMVQYPELTDENSEAYKANYKNICEIGKERIRRAGDKIKQEIEKSNEQLKLGEQEKQIPDIGFKVFSTADTNIKWNLVETLGQQNGFEYADEYDRMDFVLGTKDIDVVYEIMLRQKDVPLSDTLEILTEIGARTYLYASSYLICLETEITETLIEKLSALAPLPIKFVFRDSAFKDDIDLKDYTFRQLKSLVERNSGEKKQTYTVEFI